MEINAEEPAAETRCEEAAEVSRQLAMLSAVFSSIGEAVYYTDTERRIISWNRAAEEVTGYPAEEARGIFCKTLLNHTDENGNNLCDLHCPLVQSMESGRPSFVKEAWSLCRDGRRTPVEISCSSVHGADGSLLGTVEIFRDRTRQREVERMKEEFIAAITHDLKSPLTTIMGYAEMQAHPRFGPISEHKLSFAESIRRSGDMLLSLIDNIVSSARLEAGQMQYVMESFELPGLLGELVESFTPQAMGAGVTLDFSCPPDLRVTADRRRIRDVFHNLVSNALRYTPGGGTISICATPDSGRVRIEVADTGRGIPLTEQERLFQKFAQVRGERQGTGLGLFISKKYLAAHGSDIRLDSAPGRGTRFLFSLAAGEPLHEEAAPQAGTILLIGDDGGSAEIAAAALEREGHTVVRAATALEALELMARTPPHLVVAHSPMPDLTVEELMYLMRTSEDVPEIPLLPLSPVRPAEWEGRFAEIIPLPLEPRFLTEAVRRHLTRS